MRTVLGLSKTSTSIGWVLVDRRDVAGDPLDHDAFDIANSSAAAPVATACRVRDIATASGYTVDSVHVTTSGNASVLREALTESGFDNIVSVPLTEATKAWAARGAEMSEQASAAVCILGRDSASLSIIDPHSGATRTSTTTSLCDNAALVDWLNTALGVNGYRPEVLYLIGSRARLDAAAGPLGAGLSIPVVATHDAQLALARGAAMSTATLGDASGRDGRSRFAMQVKSLTVVGAVAVVSLLALSAADSPITLAEATIAHPVPRAPRSEEAPGWTAPAAPIVFAPPSAAPQPVPERPPTTSAPEAPATPVSATPAQIPAAVPQTAEMPPPAEHLPDAQPMQHIPDAQLSPVPGPAAPPTPVDSSPPLPLDPSLMNPFFGGLP